MSPAGSGDPPRSPTTSTSALTAQPTTSDASLSVLAELGAKLRGVDDDVPFRLDAKTLAAGQNFTFMTDVGPLDVLGLPAGISNFDELAVNATTFDLGEGLTVAVCDLDDLIRMKRAAGRPKDRIELEVLGAVREEREHDRPTRKPD